MRRAAATALTIWVWVAAAHAQVVESRPDSTASAIASSLFHVIAPNAADTPRQIFVDGFRQGATDSAAVQHARAVLIGESVSKMVSRDFGAAALGISTDDVINRICDYLLGTASPMQPQQAQQILESAYSTALTSPADSNADPAEEAAFLNQAASVPGAETLDGGVIYIPQKQGKGNTPQAGNTVVVTYTATLSDGSEFDATGYTPASLHFDSLVEGMRTGLARMRPGGKAILFIPAEKAYGAEGFPGVIPGGAALRFDIELIEIK